MSEHVTYCRICEPLCGLIATVEDGEVKKLRPDPDHPISKGFACPKGIAMAEVQNSPERITRPMRKQPDGSFAPVSWDEALADIGSRLRGIRADHGTDSVGMFMGNPVAFSYSALVWCKGFMDALESPHFYTSSSQDTSSRLVASALMYGSPLTVPVPDFTRTDFALILGANPVTSHGSMVSGANVRKELEGVVDRGGRVVVVDPRRSETARLFEHVPVRPGADAWMLLSMLQVIFSEGLADPAAGNDADGLVRLRELAAQFPPEETAARSGVDPTAVRELARSLAAADRGLVYGRVGVGTNGFGTLVCFLIDALSYVTGNLDSPGGNVFPTPPIDVYEPVIKRGLDTWGAKKSRIGGFADVLGSMPATVMADEIKTPGEGRLRALFLISGNPVLSVPNGRRLEDALDDLDLMVTLDFGINDTSRHSDYVLPVTTFLEREDMPLQMFPYQLRTFVQWTDPVVEPRGEARQEWRILHDIAAEIGIVPSSLPAIRRLGRLARGMLRPRPMFDAMLRTGAFGDRFGLRRDGISIKRLKRDHPHGRVLAEHVPTGVLSDRITHDDGRLRLLPGEIESEVRRMQEEARPDPDLPLLLFGRRELRAINSWMKNSPLLSRGPEKGGCMIHPDDASAAGVADGQRVRIVSENGDTEARAEISPDVFPGSISVPHGGGRTVRVDGSPDNGDAGPDYNALTPDGVDAIEALAGMSRLTGIPVRVEPMPMSMSNGRTAEAGEPAEAEVAAG